MEMVELLVEEVPKARTVSEASVEDVAVNQILDQSPRRKTQRSKRCDASEVSSTRGRGYDGDECDGIEDRRGIEPVARLAGLVGQDESAGNDRIRASRSR